MEISALELLITGIKLENKGTITSVEGVFNVSDLDNSGTIYGKTALLFLEIRF